MRHGIVAELGLGYAARSYGIIWTQITPYVKITDSEGIDISRGAAEELSDTQVGSMSLRLDNADGRFTPERSASPYYPYLRRNTPIRLAAWTMDETSGSAPWPLAQLGDDFPTEVFHARWQAANAAVSVGGRARITCDSGYNGLVSARSWRLPNSNVTVRIPTPPAAGGWAQLCVNSATTGTRLGIQVNTGTGQVSFASDVGYFDAGAVSIAYSRADHLWVRIRHAGTLVYWETSHDGFTWVTRRTLTAPAWVAADTVTVSLEAHRDTGAADVAEFDLLGAAAVPRFYGMVNEWPVAFHGLHSTVDITCSDLFKLLSRVGPMRPMLVQEILADQPLAMWPMSEGANATTLGNESGINAPTGASSLQVIDTGELGAVELGAAAGAGQLPAPLFTPDLATGTGQSYLAADLGSAIQAAAAGDLYLVVWFSAPKAAATAADLTICTLTSPAGESIRFGLDLGTGVMRIDLVNLGGGYANAYTGTRPLADGRLHQFIYHKYGQSTYIDGAWVGGNYPLLATDYPYRYITVGAHRDGSLPWSGIISCLAIYGAGGSLARMMGYPATAATGHAGESAAARAARLLGYAGMTSTAFGQFGQVDAQLDLGSKALDHLREVEAADQGRLLCDRGSPAVVLFSRTVRYNPTSSWSVAYADLEPGATPVKDDTKMINTITASRPQGGTVRVVDEDSVDAHGPYEKQLTLIKVNDEQVVSAARSLLHRYADPPSELRQVTIQGTTMGLASYRQLLLTDVSTFFTITGLPAASPASAYMVVTEGYREEIRAKQHTLTFFTSRADTTPMWTLGSTTYSVLGSTTRLAL